MENILQVFGDMTGCWPLSSQEQLQSIQVKGAQAPPPSSYESMSFNPQINLEVVSSGIDNFQQLDQHFILLEENKGEGLNFCGGNTQCPNVQNRLSGNGRETTEQVWQRIRWTDDMVMVLISAVSYFWELASFDGPENERSHMKGKWRSISKALLERGYVVSPQQCEDKFNDLNKKYKRLNCLLGTDTLADVVENPQLMELMNIPELVKEEVRKILACKQLFYKEMHSYHHKNREFLLHDVALQESVLSNLQGRARCQDLIDGMPLKRQKHGQDDGAFNQVEDVDEDQEVREWMTTRSLELEEKKLSIHEQRLGLEKKKFEWLRSCEVEDQELRQMKVGNELMKLENERLAFELKCRERGNAIE